MPLNSGMYGFPQGGLNTQGVPMYDFRAQYFRGNIVMSPTDNNLYIAVQDWPQAAPTDDNGTWWALWYVTQSVVYRTTQFIGNNDPAGLQNAVNFISGCTGVAAGQTITLKIPDGGSPYSYGTNTINISLPLIGPFVSIVGDAANTVVAPAFFPTLSTATTGGSLVGNGSTTYLYVAITYTTAGGETMAGPVTQVLLGNTSTNTVTVAAISGLSSAITAVNYYYTTSSTPSGTAWQKVTATPSAGAVASKTITSWSPTTQPPTSNPTFPCVLSFGNANGLVITNTPGLTINGLQVYGNGSGSYNGVTLNACQNVTVGPNVAVSNWGGYCVFGYMGSVGVVSGAQVDHGAAGIHIGGNQGGRAMFVCHGTNALACTIGFAVNEAGFIDGLSTTASCYAGVCTTGFQAYRCGYISYYPCVAGAQNAFDCTTSCSPTVNSAPTNSTNVFAIISNG